MPLRVQSVRDLYAHSENRTVKILIAGPPGAGKTLFCSTFPNVLYADIEGRLLSVRNRDVRRMPIETLRDIEDLKRALDQPRDVRKKLLGFDVRTIVLDTIDELSKIVQKERIASEKREVMSMADWGWYGDTMRSILRGYRNLEELNVIFTVHLKSSEDSETGRVEYKPAIQGQVGDEVAGYVDEALLLVARPTTDPDTGDRVLRRHLQTYPDSQHTWVKDHSGRLGMEFAVDFETDYERLFTTIFGEVVTDVPTTTPEPEPQPTPEPEPKPEPQPAASNQPVANGNGKAVPTDPPLRRKPGRRREEIPPVVDVPLPTEEISAPAAAAQATLTKSEEPEAPPVEPQPEPVPEKGTETPEPSPAPDSETFLCAECGEVIDNPDYAELSDIRYGVYLCRTHFAARQKKR